MRKLYRALREYFKRLARRLLERRGWRSRHIPAPLRANPDAELELDLVLLFRSLLRHRGEGVVLVQVGAGDGETSDPVYKILSSENVEAILVEPQPEMADAVRKLHEKNPRIRVVQTAISAQSGRQLLYRARPLKRPAGAEERGMSSFDPAHISSHTLRAKFAPEEIESIEVECVTLSDLMREENVPGIDVLVVDAEGSDDIIVGQALNLSSPPVLIQFEHRHLTRERYHGLLYSLISRKYKIVHLPEDTICVLSRD